MRERPILFSAPMVRAILIGAKTQTRRVVAPQPAVVSAAAGRMPGLIRVRASDTCLATHEDACPYGAPGDRLWVRETWGLCAPVDTTDWHRGSVRGETAESLLDRWSVEYAADFGPNDESCHWRPSIHMPRWASRLTLEISSVRVERLTSISEEDARAEGVTVGDVGCPCEGDAIDAGPHVTACAWARDLDPDTDPHRAAFAALWDAINGKRAGCAWRDDPWCWVIGFKRASAGGGV